MSSAVLNMVAFLWPNSSNYNHPELNKCDEKRPRKNHWPGTSNFQKSCGSDLELLLRINTEKATKIMVNCRTYRLDNRSFKKQSSWWYRLELGQPCCWAREIWDTHIWPWPTVSSDIIKLVRLWGLGLVFFNVSPFLLLQHVWILHICLSECFKSPSSTLIFLKKISVYCCSLDVLKISACDFFNKQKVTNTLWAKSSGFP
jgi:hypothetical protein